VNVNAAYDAYSRSGVEWLGNVPSHWNMTKVKHVAPFQVGWTPSTKNDANFEGENLWANISDIKVRVITDTAKRISDDAATVASMEITPRGSLLYSFKLSVGAVAFAGVDMYTNEAIASFLPNKSLLLSFLYYPFPIFIIQNSATNIYGARILNQDLIKNADLVAPPVGEATQIAKFLDYETTKIDALIEKQQQLIALLQEKRQAVISHAVTKGLNPDVHLRDSGVEWLGDVPAHWTVCAMKRDAWVQGGYAFKSDDFGAEGEPVVRIGDIKMNGGVGVDGCKRVPELVASPLGVFVVEPGDIVMAMTGATIGKAGKIPEGEAALLNQRVGAFRLASGRLVYGFLWFILGSEGYLEHVRLTADGGAQPNISDTGMLAYQLVLPPTVEQVTIVEYLKRTLPAFDKLVERTKAAVELLQERRAALISAAVTGKIDVRGWKPPESATEEELP